MQKHLKSQEEIDLEQKIKDLKCDKRKLTKEIIDIDTEIGWIRLKLESLDKNKRHLK